MLYGTTVREDLGEEILLTGWNLIGNKRTRLYRYSTLVDSCDKGVDLPCNCDIIEAVTTDFEEWNYSTNDTPNGDISSSFIEAYIENRKALPSMTMFFYICEFLNISPRDFFDEGLVDPIEYHKLLENLKELSPEQLIHISALIRDLNNVSNSIGRRD